MTVEQTRNVIEQVRRFHQWASQYYHRLADSTQRDLAKLLLEYMSGHERRLADCLDEYEAEAPTKILDTWLIEPGGGRRDEATAR